ncbi:MAG: YggU family protein [Nitrospirae bacterium CG17_big_fil_post_rev_8_21_14_2_50_50_9]|nr:MAG: YggU family protein [Nitrospirae bacterium CG17_big_fil_post_rev_8_21_14_2_50_50_9]
MFEFISKEDERGVTLKVRVQPGASRDEIIGVVEGALRIRLTSPPVEGAANKRCIRFLSKKLRIAQSRISILRGERSREKILRVQGLTSGEVRDRLSI